MRLLSLVGKLFCAPPAVSIPWGERPSQPVTRNGSMSRRVKSAAQPTT